MLDIGSIFLYILAQVVANSDRSMDVFPPDIRPGWLHEAVDTREAARITGRPVSTLETMRVRGGGPPFLKHGRCVRYRRGDLFDWLQAGLCTSTSGSGMPKQE